MKTSTTTLIDAPASTIFLWLEDNQRLKQWVPNLVEDEPLIETPERVGSCFRQVFVEKGREMEMEGEITAYVPNERMRVMMTGAMFNLDVDYKLRALSETRTEVMQDTEIAFKGVLKLMTPIMWLTSKLSSKDPQAEAHARLKEKAEGEFNAS
jgi:uncharacterized protein YndB with AHSA1/START domain